MNKDSSSSDSDHLTTPGSLYEDDQLLYARQQLAELQLQEAEDEVAAKQLLNEMDDFVGQLQQWRQQR